MLSMQLSKRFVQQIVLDGFAFVGILNNLLVAIIETPPPFLKLCQNRK